MYVSFGKNGGDSMAVEYIQIEATFGVNAGMVWQALSKLGTATPIMIKKETTLTLDDVYGALGWLAREGKIVQIRDGDIIMFRLNE